MSLYEDEELGAPPTDVAVGWSRGVQLMQSQMQLKKAASKTAPTLVPGSFSGPTNVPGPPIKTRTALPVLAPVINLKSKTKQDEPAVPSFGNKTSKKSHGGRSLVSNDKTSLLPLGDPNWTPVNEYDPLWPNEYSKVVADMKESKRATEDEDSSRKRRYTEVGRDKARERFDRDGKQGSNAGELSGFGRRPRCDNDYSDEEDDRHSSRRGSSASGRRSAGSSGGAAIAPPPSLTESTKPTQPEPQNGEGGDGLPANKGGLGFAAKIMAKYGYKEGQGLGRTQQGMSKALSVEKTSKRGGRILHEKDLMPPPMFGESFQTPQSSATPPSLSQIEDDEDEYGPSTVAPADDSSKPSITDLMKAPSKVVQCKNMVGPGEVDDDLEPEVKEECNGKYGEVVKVVIYELQNVVPEEAVRIFIEFKRVESAIKAVVDLNGRFFGGREVQAQFYDHDKFSSYNLGE